MKKNCLKLLTILAIVSVLFTSCQKEYVYPSEEYGAKVPSFNEGPTIDRFGVFLIIDAVMYVENLETGEKTVYKHFDINKSRSSLRWGGAMFDIEKIIKDTTTYSFYAPAHYPGVGKFVLNGDTTKHYGVNYISIYSTIIEDPVYGMTEQLLGGSARPFTGQVWDINQKTIAMQIQESVGSINGQNVRYWTQLKLKKIEDF